MAKSKAQSRKTSHNKSFIGEDWMQGKNGKPVFGLVVEEREGMLQIHACLPRKRAVAIWAGVGAGLWALIQNVQSLELVVRKVLGQ